MEILIEGIDFDNVMAANKQTMSYLSCNFSGWVIGIFLKMDQVYAFSYKEQKHVCHLKICD